MSHIANKLRTVSSDALIHINEHATELERGTPTPERPLAGRVHIQGVGHVTLDQIKAELARRGLEQ